MKKLLLVLLCLSLLNSTFAFAEQEQIPLTAGGVDNTPSYPGKGKVPMRIPAIYIDGYTLNLSLSHPEYIINIVQDNEIVFSSVIPEGVTTFDLPEYIEGESMIQFITDRFCFTGYIEL